VAVPKDYFTHNWPIVVLAWIACATLDIVWATLLVFTKELFPTTHRTMALGIASAACRMGSVLSPYVILLDVYDPVLSLGFYSCLSLSSGILSLWIWPETKALRLPDTLEEAEKAASMPNSWLRKCNSNSVWCSYPLIYNQKYISYWKAFQVLYFQISSLIVMGRDQNFLTRIRSGHFLQLGLGHPLPNKLCTYPCTTFCPWESYVDR